MKEGHEDVHYDDKNRADDDSAAAEAIVTVIIDTLPPLSA